MCCESFVHHDRITITIEPKNQLHFARVHGDWGRMSLIYHWIELNWIGDARLQMLLPQKTPKSDLTKTNSRKKLKLRTAQKSSASPAPYEVCSSLTWTAHVQSYCNKRVNTWEKVHLPHINMAAVSSFWDTNVAWGPVKTLHTYNQQLTPLDLARVH